jgi:hypothetical protein
MIDKQFDILEKTRKVILNIVDDLSIDQINTIPSGFNNNIAWNFGHLVVTQQLLCYRMSGLECNVDEDSINSYKKGTAPDPEVRMTEKELQLFKELFISNIDRIKQDYQSGKFKEYKNYTTSMDIALNRIEDAISFNNMHEGMHLGYILALRKYA